MTLHLLTLALTLTPHPRYPHLSPTTLTSRFAHRRFVPPPPSPPYCHHSFAPRLKRASAAGLPLASLVTTTRLTDDRFDAWLASRLAAHVAGSSSASAVEPAAEPQPAEMGRAEMGRSDRRAEGEGRVEDVVEGRQRTTRGDPPLASSSH